MRLRWILVFICIGFFSCSDRETQVPPALSYFPGDIAVLIRVNNFEDFRNTLETHPFFKKSANIGQLKPVLNKLDGLRAIRPEGEILIGLYEEGLGRLSYLIVAKNKTQFFDRSRLSDSKGETLNYKKKVMKKYTAGEEEIYAMLENELLLISSSRLILEKLIRTGPAKELSQDFLKMYQTADPRKNATLIVNPTFTSYLFRNELNPASLNYVSEFADWVSLDMEPRPQGLVLNGVTTPSDSTLQWVDLFEGSIADREQVSDYAPNTSEAVLSVHFQDFQVFANNQEALLERKVVRNDSLFQTLEELGIMYMGDQRGIMLRSYGVEQVNTFILNHRVDTRRYKNIEINLLPPDNDWFKESLDPLIRDFRAEYCVLFENTTIFTSDLSKMQEIITHYQQGTVFRQSQAYQSAAQSLAEESSVRFVSRSARVSDILERSFGEEMADDFQDENFDEYSFAFQLVRDQGFYHTTSQFAPLTTRNTNSKADVQWSVLLGAEAATTPQFVLNHYTGKQEVVVQDINNNLYLISEEGDILWKIKLDSKINGRIHQVDLYRNGKLQLAFCTDSRFQVYDRKGRLVQPFDMEFPGGNLNPLAVFDYDNNRNYRFLVTQGKKVFMFDGRGKNVNGFKLSRVTSDVIQPPVHVRLNNKDFLVFQLADGTLKITHRTGKDRLRLNEKIDFSDNPVFVYKNKISVTDRNGVLHQVDATGKLTTTDFNLEKDHLWFATAKTLAIINDYNLNIKGKKTELDVGVYTAPHIFYVNDRIFVSITDIQNENSYLFDSEAGTIPGFPISGNSGIDLSDMDKDGQLEAVIKDAGNAITVYQL